MRIYRGYEIIEEYTGRIFVYEYGTPDDANPCYVAEDWDDLDQFIDANPA